MGGIMTMPSLTAASGSLWFFTTAEVQRRSLPAAVDVRRSGWTAAKERETDRFDHERATVIQLKDYEVLSGDRPLEQIREAYEWYSPQAAVILTTAGREASAFATARDALSEEIGIPVSVVLGHQLAAWFLGHLRSGRGRLIT
jgi:hypothetical protein